MKQIIFGLLLPLFSFAQTIHHEDGKIVYKGNVHIGLSSNNTVLSRLQSVFPVVAEKSTDSVRIQSMEKAIEAYGEIRLKSPYHIIRTLHFTIQLTPIEGGYAYNVDSVSVSERRRGMKETVTTAAELIEDLEETGNAAIELEILLNEIDLRIQKLLTILENEMKKQDASTAKVRLSNRKLQ